MSFAKGDIEGSIVAPFFSLIMAAVESLAGHFTQDLADREHYARTAAQEPAELQRSHLRQPYIDFPWKTHPTLIIAAILHA